MELAKSKITLRVDPDPILRKKSSLVKKVDAEFRDTVTEMFKIMESAGGVGLAANQVGVTQRFFIVKNR